MKIEASGISAEMIGRAAMSAVRAAGRDEPERENDPAGKEHSRGRDMYIPTEEENAGIYEQVSEEGRAVVRFRPMEDSSPKSEDDGGTKPSDKNVFPEMENKEDLPKSGVGDKPDKSKGDKRLGDSKKSENCTANTDKVDREIKALREKLKKLKEQAARAEGKKKKEFESKISALEKELAMKDNDSYRRQHTEFH